MADDTVISEIEIQPTIWKGPGKGHQADDVWEPDHNPTQKKIFNSTALYNLAHSEKGSGKTIGCLDALIRHCYEEDDALALVMSPQKRTGTIGVFNDLKWCLDRWANGNWADREMTKRKDRGIGLNYSEEKLDPNTKDVSIYIENQHGTVSRIILVSIPYAEVVQKRMRGLSPSFVYVDEVTMMDSPDFFTYVILQLGRRRKIIGPQQYYASCNPEGPSHWVHKVFITGPRDPKTGKWNDNFAVFHVPIKENVKNLPDGYFERVVEGCVDPIDLRRLAYGEWVERTPGEAIFKNFFIRSVHIKGSPQDGYLTPHPGFPIILGWDPGPANFCVTFEQMLPAKDKTIWTVFDELNWVGQYMPDFQAVKRVLDRMDYWNKTMKKDFKYIHIADEAAFTQVRPDGTYDATRMRDLSKRRINFWPCPKGKDSIVARVDMTISLLLNDSLFVSAMCPKTLEMFRVIASEKVKEGERHRKYDPDQSRRPKRNEQIHPFDSLTYPMYYFIFKPSAYIIQQPDSSGVFSAGGSRG